MTPSSVELDVKKTIDRHRQMASFNDTEESRQKISLGLAIAVIVVMVLEMIVSLAYKANRASELTTQKRKYDDLQNQLKKPEIQAKEKRLIALSAGLSVLKDQLDTKIDYGKFWSLIQDSQVKGVVYTSLALDDKGNMRVDAKTTNYELLAKQIQSFKQHQCNRKTDGVKRDAKVNCFTKVELANIAKSEEGVGFGLILAMDRQIIIQSNEMKK